MVTATLSVAVVLLLLFREGTLINISASGYDEEITALIMNDSDNNRNGVRSYSSPTKEKEYFHQDDNLFKSAWEQRHIAMSDESSSSSSLEQRKRNRTGNKSHRPRHRRNAAAKTIAAVADVATAQLAPSKPQHRIDDGAIAKTEDLIATTLRRSGDYDYGKKLEGKGSYNEKQKEVETYKGGGYNNKKEHYKEGYGYEKEERSGSYEEEDTSSNEYEEEYGGDEYDKRRGYKEKEEREYYNKKEKEGGRYQHQREYDEKKKDSGDYNNARSDEYDGGYYDRSGDEKKYYGRREEKESGYGSEERGKYNKHGGYDTNKKGNEKDYGNGGGYDAYGKEEKKYAGGGYGGGSRGYSEKKGDKYGEKGSYKETKKVEEYDGDYGKKDSQRRYMNKKREYSYDEKKYGDEMKKKKKGEYGDRSYGEGKTTTYGGYGDNEKKEEYGDGYGTSEYASPFQSYYGHHLSYDTHYCSVHGSFSLTFPSTYYSSSYSNKKYGTGDVYKGEKKKGGGDYDERYDDGYQDKGRKEVRRHYSRQYCRFAAAHSLKACRFCCRVVARSANTSPEDIVAAIFAFSTEKPTSLSNSNYGDNDKYDFDTNKKDGSYGNNYGSDYSSYDENIKFQCVCCAPKYKY